MNLMFWKKKARAAEEAAPEDPAGNTRESLDFVAAKPDDAGAGAGTDDAEPPKQGLAARLKSRFDILLRHFRKAPAFRAEAGPAPEAPAAPGKAADAAEAGPESSAAETSAAPALSVRIKLGFAAFLRRFRKTPPPAAEEGHPREGHTEEADEPAGEAAPAKPGLLARIRAGFSAFVRELKGTTAAPAGEEEEETDTRGRSEASPEEGEIPAGETAAEPVRSRRWLVVGGSVVIAILLLIDIGIAIWPAFEPPEKRWGTKHNITSISSRPFRPEPAPGEPETEADALRRENAELQARIEALKKAQQPQQSPVPPPQQVYIPPARQGKGSAPSPAVSGELTVGNSDPQAAAMTLKEAIEAMNAGTGDYGRKPAK